MLIEVIRMSDKRLNYFNGYLYGIGATRCFDFRKKEDCTSQHVAYMLDRTHTMFRWENLPETIPERVLELYLQIRGNCCFHKHEGHITDSDDHLPVVTVSRLMLWLVRLLKESN